METRIEALFNAEAEKYCNKITSNQKCRKLLKATITMKLTDTRKPVIVFVLDRAKAARGRDRYLKDPQQVPIGEDISLPLVGGGHQNYRLISAIQHVGDFIDSGHWRAHLKKDNEFYQTSDAQRIVRSNIKDLESSSGFMYIKV